MKFKTLAELRNLSLEDLEAELANIGTAITNLIAEIDAAAGDGEPQNNTDPQAAGDGGAQGDGTAPAGGTEPQQNKANIADLQKRANALTDYRKQVNGVIEEKKQLIKTRNSLAEGVAAGRTGKPMQQGGVPAMNAKEKRALEFVKTGRLETRAILSTGKIAKPTEVGGINGLAAVADSIVDDVHSFSLTGNGAWTAAYKKTDAEAADFEDGAEISGTGSTYDYVTINPGQWGVIDEISNQVKKMTPLDYAAEIEKSALIALRSVAAKKILAALGTSTLVEARAGAALDQTYVRDLVLNFRSIDGKGQVVLYINQADLATLGKVRGTNEKKAVYDISFDDGQTTSGTIKDGGTAVRFRIIDALEVGTQYFGQPGTIDMPMWDDYEIATDEGGKYFSRNMMGIRGLQTAGADLVAYHGMQKITQAAASGG